MIKRAKHLGSNRFAVLNNGQSRQKKTLFTVTSYANYPHGCLMPLLEKQRIEAISNVKLYFGIFNGIIKMQVM